LSPWRLGIRARVTGIRELFNDLFPEFRMLIERKAFAGEVEKVFVGHIRITRIKTNYTAK
jgi:hypothetical protein